jgi:hypothetical protein
MIVYNRQILGYAVLRRQSVLYVCIGQVLLRVPCVPCVNRRSAICAVQWGGACSQNFVHEAGYS